MILIIHGENTVLSRKYVLGVQEKLSIQQKNEIKPKDVTAVEFSQILGSPDFFGNFPLVILDVTDAGRTNLDAYLEAITNSPKEINLIIYSGKSLTKTNIFIQNEAKLKAKVIASEILENSNIFKFTDMIFSGNRIGAYREYEKLIKDDFDNFYIFTMIASGLRGICAAKFNSENYNKMKPFSKDKLANQAKNFTDKQLKDLYKTLAEIDKKMKTGLLDPSLGDILALEKIFLCLPSEKRST